MRDMLLRSSSTTVMTLQQSNTPNHHNTQQHSKKPDYLDPRLWTPEERELVYNLIETVFLTCKKWRNIEW